LLYTPLFLSTTAFALAKAHEYSKAISNFIKRLPLDIKIAEFSLPSKTFSFPTVILSKLT
jgi:hypothetical protein